MDIKIKVAGLVLALTGLANAASQQAPLTLVETVGQRIQIEVPGSVNYPMAVRDLKLQGRAVVQAVIGADGKASQVRIARTSGSRYLDQAALRTIRRSRFVVLDPSASLAIHVPVEFSPVGAVVADY